MPTAFARLIAGAGEAIGSLTGIAPLIAKGELAFLRSHPVPVADRARSELGWEVTPWEEGLSTTIEELRRRRAVPA
jgi:dihydroflavonol-4-reductase